MKRLAILLGSTLAVTASRSANAQCHYRVTILPTVNCGSIGQDGGTPYALNDYGQVAGKHSHCLADGDSPFAWAAGPTIGTIPLPQGVDSAEAYAISNLFGSNGIGMLGGMAHLPGQYRPFIWWNGQWQFLSFGKNTSPGAVFALNDSGMAAGYTSTTDAWIATYWLNGQAHFLSLPYGRRSMSLGVSPTGAIVGWMGLSPGVDSHAFLWENGIVTDLGVVPQGLDGAARSINRKRQIAIGGRTDPQSNGGAIGKAFIWQDGQWTDLGILSGYNNTGPSAINDRSEVVGICRSVPDPGSPAPVLETGWIWRNGALSDLSALLLPGSGLNPGVGNVRAINNEGQITAESTVGSQAGGDFHGVSVLLTPVPDNAGDTNCDGLVNIDDLVNVITRWGPCSHGFCSCDLDGNGTINVQDLVLVLLNWKP